MSERAKAVRLRDMRGLGPRMEEWLIQVNVCTPEELMASDPFEVYARLKRQVPGTSVNALYGLIAAIEDGDWIEVKRTRRGEILMRLEDMGLAPG